VVLADYRLCPRGSCRLPRGLNKRCHQIFAARKKSEAADEMNALVATDRTSDPLRHVPAQARFTRLLARSHDPRMRLSRPLRWLLLLCVLAAVIVCGRILLLSSEGPGTETRIDTASVVPAHQASATRASTEKLREPDARPNPAAQRAGPPDPVEQKTAVESAERAAKVAAGLAGSSSSN
jgi:hypothetical protein